MKIRTLLIAASAVALWVGFLQPSAAQEKPSLTSEMKAIVDQVNTKLKNGQDTEKDLAENLQQLDALWARHKDEKSDEVARILGVKATIYVRVGNDAASQTILQQIVKEYPDTKSAQAATKMLAAIQKQEEAKKIAASLAPGSVFPDFSEKDLNGKPLSVAAYRGKVVLVDFWATWCGPCVAELPNVLKTYQKYHSQGFEIIGISLDQEKQKLESFLKQKGITWQQYFDGEGWENKLAAKYGIESIPAAFLLDGQGKIIGTDLRGEALSEAVAKALAKK